MVPHIYANAIVIIACHHKVKSVDLLSVNLLIADLKKSQKWAINRSTDWKIADLSTNQQISQSATDSWPVTKLNVDSPASLLGWIWTTLSLFRVLSISVLLTLTLAMIPSQILLAAEFERRWQWHPYQPGSLPKTKVMQTMLALILQRTEPGVVPLLFKLFLPSSKPTPMMLRRIFQPRLLRVVAANDGLAVVSPVQGSQDRHWRCWCHRHCHRCHHCHRHHCHQKFRHRCHVAVAIIFVLAATVTVASTATIVATIDAALLSLLPPPPPPQLLSLSLLLLLLPPLSQLPPLQPPSSLPSSLLP